MASQVQKKEEYSKDINLIETVRSCVFKGSTDNEMKLYFFKCQEVGVHPLSQLIVPVAYTDKYGERKVSFISTIDHFRAMSEDAGDYDGMDEIEFKGEKNCEYDSEQYTVPEEAICRVYRKEFTRPFVGKARWEEFYPGDKKGHMWRKMPTIMLGKCAEAQARRLAWPKKLNKLYTAEEMERGFEAMASIPNQGSKPFISAESVIINPNTSYQKTDYSYEVKNWKRPTESEIKKGKLISEKQGFFLIGECKKNGVEYSSVAAAAKVENIFYLTWNKRVITNFDTILHTVQNEPNRFTKYSKAAMEAKNAVEKNIPSVMDQQEFSELLESLSLQSGVSITEGLKECCGVDMVDDVLPEAQSQIIDWFQHKIDEKEQI